MGSWRGIFAALSPRCARAALAMFSFTIWCIPQAISSTRMPSCCGHMAQSTCGQLPRRASSPRPENSPDRSIPASRFASVTVAFGRHRARSRPGPARRRRFPGPTFSKPECVHVGNAASARPDFDHIDDGDLDGETTALTKAVHAIDFELPRLERDNRPPPRKVSQWFHPCQTTANPGYPARWPRAAAASAPRGRPGLEHPHREISRRSRGSRCHRSRA